MRSRLILTGFAVLISGLIHDAVNRAPAWAAAGDQAGTITYVEGTVKLFTNPRKALAKSDVTSAPTVRFEGLYYTIQDAKIGDRITQGAILRTAPGARARVVFENGDQYHVAPESAYRANANGSGGAGKRHAEIGIDYGKLRGVVSKDGPRSRLVIKTKSATMGVRGTDFYVSDRGNQGGTQVSVLRGAVELKPEWKKIKPVMVEKGFSAAVPGAEDRTQAAKTAEPTPEVYDAMQEGGNQPLQPAQPAPSKKVDHLQIELRKTTKTDLAVLQREISPRQELKLVERVEDEKLRVQVEALEKKAVETTLKDIQAADPQLYAKVSQESNLTIQKLNTGSVNQVFVNAPTDPGKPFRGNLEDLEDDAYQRYYKLSP